MNFLLGETFRTKDLEIFIRKVLDINNVCAGCFMKNEDINICEIFVTEYFNGYCNGVVFDKIIYK